MNRPNILHLFTDMQRADTIRALGNPVIRTPNLDRLATSGVAFDNAFTPSPVCVAARCSMIFGQYPFRTGCYRNGPMPVDERETFMAALNRSGYTTHGIGKCHFTPERYALRGFTSREVQEEGGVSMDQIDQNPYIKHLTDDRGYRHITEAYGVRGEMYYVPQVAQVPAEDHPSQWIGDRSIEFLESHAEDSDPWYLFSSFIHPHPPFTPPTPWHKLYRPSLMPLPNVPADSDELLTLINRIQNRYKYRDKGTDPNLIRAIIAYYYACISFVDFQIGRILEALERSGQIDNTLIIFTSDHGEYLGDFDSFGKRAMHDPSARIPLILRQPGVFEGGRRVSTPANLVDIAPTILAAAGAEIETHAPDGIDLSQVADGSCDREFVFSQYAVSNSGGQGELSRDTDTTGRSWSEEEWHARLSIYMAVSDRWKYCYSAPDDREFLFDRRADPLETRNRAGIPFCSDAKERARSALTEELGRAGETAGIENGAWRRFPRVELESDPDAGLLIQDGYTPWAQMEIPGYTDAD